MAKPGNAVVTEIKHAGVEIEFHDDLVALICADGTHVVVDTENNMLLIHTRDDGELYSKPIQSN